MDANHARQPEPTATTTPNTPNTPKQPTPPTGGGKLTPPPPGNGVARSKIEAVIGRPESAPRDVRRTGEPQTGAPIKSLADTFLDERDDVLTVVNELEDQLDRYEELRAGLEKELHETQSHLGSARQRIQELEWHKVSLETRVELVEQAKRDVAALEEELSDANARSQRLAEKLSATEKELARLTEEIKTASKQLEELWVTRKERDTLRAEVRAVRLENEQLVRNQRDWTEERTLLTARVDETQRALTESTAARAQLELDVRAGDERQQEARRVQEALEQKIESLRTDGKTLRAQITHLERENNRLTEQRKFYETEVASLRGTNRSVEAALGSVKKAFAEVRIALAETKARTRRRSIEPAPRTPGDSADAGTTSTAASISMGRTNNTSTASAINDETYAGVD